MKIFLSFLSEKVYFSNGQKKTQLRKDNNVPL